MKKFKLSDKLVEAINEQIRLELESSYIYTGMRLYFEDLGCRGAAHWMDIQAEEEQEHAEAFVKFLIEMECPVELRTINAQPTKYNSYLEVFEKALEHEKAISASIFELLDLTLEEKNYAAENLVRKFVDEQLEEENTAKGIVDLIKFAGDNPAAIFEIDSALAKRE